MEAAEPEFEPEQRPITVIGAWQQQARPDAPDFQATARLRSTAVSELPAANVSHVDGTQPIEWQLYGTLTVRIFLLPESSHP